MNNFIIGNAVVVTVNKNMEIISNGAVAVSGNIIKDIGTTVNIKKKYPSYKFIDTKNSLVMPGLINTHTHLPMSMVRGLAEDIELQEWLLKTYEFKMKFLPADAIHTGVKLSLMELIKNGTTTICDMSFHQHIISEIVKSFGIRAVLCDTMMAKYYKREIFNDIEKFLNTDYKTDLIIKGLALHAPYTCDIEQFEWLKKMLVKYPGLLYSIHLCETKNETFLVKKKLGETPVNLLRKRGLLTDNLLAVHCVWLTDKEIELFKKFNVKVSYNPESNMKLGSGTAPIVKMLKKNIIVGIGTDGAASNNDLDLFSEIDSGAKLQKAGNINPTSPTATDMVRMATINGAKCLGIEKITGSLEPGKKADIIILELQQIRLKPVYDINSQIVFSVNGRDVTDVIINGKFIVRNRKFTICDEKIFLDYVNNLNKKINQKIKYLTKSNK
ncbi:amidohydrolase [Candidatus Dependentiae bacterium]|nr:amidohydrolase [Candidatus Dependentiae bacterium]